MAYSKPRLLLVLGLLAAGIVRGEVSFNRDIRPIMADTCFRCHGPDKNSRMLGLRLDIREEALRRTASGVVPITPGKPDESAIIDRIFAKDSARRMPPVSAHKELTETQKITIRQWVAEGARYEGHWAYLPVKRPLTPQASNSMPPIHNPIDSFIQSRLNREGIQPSAEADRRTLIRRVTLDLTGLAPTPEEVDIFLKDRSANAYEKVVDRLLASPRYAEQQAVHWLDAVRYADTVGFHSDLPYPIWPYRDYVLRAFRDNKPFDLFTREQLAGDLLPNATSEQLVASAFNRLNRVSPEGGLQPKEYLAKYAADRVRTVSTVWMGSTLGCAECHDHKFDPFTSKDFYSFKAFFADILEEGRAPDVGREAWGSKIDLPTQAQQRQREQAQWRLTEVSRNLEREARIMAADSGWEAEILKLYDAGKLNWQYQRPISAQSANGARLTIYNQEPVESSYSVGNPQGERAPGNGLVVADGPNPDNETYTITLRPGEGTWTALGVEAVQDESLPSHRVARGSDRLVLTEVEAELSADGQSPGRKLSFVLATASGRGDPPMHPMAAIDGDPRTGWGVVSNGSSGNQFLALRFAQRVSTRADSVLRVRLRHDSEFRRATIGRLRLALSSAEYSWPEPNAQETNTRQPRTDRQSGDAGLGGLSNPVRTALRVAEDKRTDTQKKALLDYYEWLSPELQPLVVETANLEAELGRLEAEIPRVVVTKATRPRVTRILPRANWMDETSEIVEPAIPAYLGKLTTGGRATRLDLANWFVSPENPLTARVFVNRLWRDFFGGGLSRSLDDLGSQGDWPVHLDLLDWLAAEFVRPEWQADGTHPWDVKHIIRTMVTSHAYRQSSMPRPDLSERDPDNRLIARQNRFRVDAEAVHDIALGVSGLLVEKFGGPSVRPYQPEGYLAALNFPKRDYSASRGEDLYRRGVYVFWQRTFLHPTLLNFDAPTREECTVDRVSSNTPLQALDLLNDPVYVEAARVFAQNALKNGGRTLDSRIDWAFQRAVTRMPTTEERRTLADLYRANLERFQAAPDTAKQFVHVGEASGADVGDSRELAAMATVARVILNLHETITRN